MEHEQYAAMDKLQRTNWWYRGRRHLVRMLIRRFAGKSGTFVDIGCGTGEGSRIVEHPSTLTGIDISDEALRLAEGKGYASLRKGSADCLPCPDGYAESILMLDVLEHVDDDRTALKECRRVLRGGGTLFLTVPAYMWLWSGHDTVFGHRRRYTKRSLVAAAREAGFSVIFCSYFVTFLLPIVALYRILERSTRNAQRSHFFPIPRFLNRALECVQWCEAFLLHLGCRMPMGSSIVLVARKAEESPI